MVSTHKPSGGTGTVQRRPLSKSGFPVWLETASGKARKRSSYAAEASIWTPEAPSRLMTMRSRGDRMR